MKQLHLWLISLYILSTSCSADVYLCDPTLVSSHNVMITSNPFAQIHIQPSTLTLAYQDWDIVNNLPIGNITNTGYLSLAALSMPLEMASTKTVAVSISNLPAGITINLLPTLPAVFSSQLNLLNPTLSIQQPSAPLLNFSSSLIIPDAQPITLLYTLGSTSNVLASTLNLTLTFTLTL